MAQYIMLANWTDQGIRNVKDSPARLDAAKQLWKKQGAEITAFYMTMGSHDMVVIVEAPNDEAVAKIVLGLGSAGNVRTTTLKAFSEAEYRKIIQTLA
ncbi:MAG TPA: GYD domain-containing protein [Geminicoccaceae bacterium]|nr:GYD domain-containing protein [Geminicoccaceae bacterium]